MKNKVIVQKSPYVMEVEPGKYSWCSCGLSAKQPFCDGAHRGTEHRPIRETVTEKKTVAWCGCKHNANGPFCDGSHKDL